MRLGTRLLAIVLGLAISGPAAAVPPDVQQRADALFQQGRDAMEKGQHAKALKLLQTSHELDPGRGKLLNIAICEERLGMVATALLHFRELSGQMPQGDSRRPIVDEYLEKILPRLPRLRIDLASTTIPEVRVMLDDAVVTRSQLGTDMPADPGGHIVVVAAPGRLDRRYDLVLEEGKSTTLRVEPGATPALTAPVTALPTSTAVPVADRRPERALWPAGLLGGAAALSLGAGIAFVVLREGKQSEARELGEPILADGRSCVPTAGNYDSVRCSSLADATATGDAFGTASVIGFVTGALAGGATMAYLLWPRPNAPAGVSIQVTPIIGGQQQGVAIRGSF